MLTTTASVARLAAVLATAAVTLSAGAAEAGKKKGRKRAAPAPVVVEEAPRSLGAELGMGFQLATPTGVTRPVATVDAAERAEAAESFDLSRLDDRRVAAPSGEGAVRMVATTLTQAQVGQVVYAHGGDVQFCWSQVPAAERTDRMVTLQVTVAAGGELESLALADDVPAQFAGCLAKAASRWAFPVVDGTSVVDYPVALRSH